MGTAQPGSAGVFAQGAGRVDVAAATTARVTVGEGGVGFAGRSGRTTTTRS
jgi:hypothetical protein